jgi:uncharacterized protein YecE (DUF72 family)
VKKGKAYIGTSGWSYKHWAGTFYPAGIKPAAQLEYYVRNFSTVELNNSFYRWPDKEQFERWRESTPDDFVFAVKASRFVTHMKKLKDPEEPVKRLLDHAVGLRKKLGPMLFQMPPGWKLNYDRLSYFLSLLPKEFRFAFEFRNTTWYDDAVVKQLADHGCAFCMYELGGHTSPVHITAGFIYVRLHGPGGKYAGSYSNDALRTWAGRIAGWRDSGLDVYVYFDNDQAGYAAFNALRLKELTILADHTG